MRAVQLPISLLAAVMSVVALVLATRLHDGDRGVSAGEMRRLEQTLVAVSEKIETLRAERAMAARADLSQREALEANPSADPDLVSRMESMEEALSELQASISSAALKVAREAADRESDIDIYQTALGQEALEAYRGEVLDAGNSTSRRAQALRLLARFPDPDQALGLVMPTVNGLLTGTLEEGEKEMIVNALGGFHDPKLVDTYVGLLQQPGEEGMKLEILRNLTDEDLRRPDVIATIRTVSESNADRLGDMAKYILRRQSP